MANPFLVLGGVAVGVVTAGIGVLQVPGWIDSANDSAARNDLAQVALAEEAANTQVGRYIPEANLLSGEYGSPAVKTGVKFQESSGVNNVVYLSSSGNRWVALSQSKSGRVFLRTSDSTAVYVSNAKQVGSDLMSAISFTSPSGGTVTISASGVLTGLSGFSVGTTGTPAATHTLATVLAGSGTPITVTN
ncbi:MULTISPECIES: hypothetical protein [Microbacterium]|uniref:hypothetical protein n=1 Tax=Microbacterium TaxID=33882 RepID=UPI00034E4313|nr:MULTISPECIES: hypothetical protein [Microbacterium]EPD84223.1 hypothetical protein HMPREF1529_02288 [Microbacterium sp. oral taxon 186 str. F0373]